MQAVLDASVVLKLLVEEPGTAEALTLLDRPSARIAPDWIMVEVAAALWNKVKYSSLLEVHAENSLALMPGFLDETVPSVDLVGSAFRLAFRLRHPVYDCLYLALAIERECQLVTADKRFFSAASAAGFEASIELLTWEG